MIQIGETVGIYAHGLYFAIDSLVQWKNESVEAILKQHHDYLITKIGASVTFADEEIENLKKLIKSKKEIDNEMAK